MTQAQALSRRATRLPDRLLRGLEAQAVSDAQSLAGCQLLAASLTDRDLRVVLDVIAGNKQRLLGLLQRLADRFEDEAPATSSLEPMQPLESFPDGVADHAALVRSLMRDEREGARYLRHLARQEPTLQRGLYALLLETLAREGETHWRMLQFVLHRVENGALDAA